MKPVLGARKSRFAPRPRAGRGLGWLAVLGCVVGAAAAGVLAAPAAWLGRAVDRASGGQLLLGEARGTVWTGSASLALTGGSGSEDASVLPGRLTWRLRPLTPLRWSVELGADCCLPRPAEVHLSLGLGSWQAAFADGVSHWPAALLAGLGTPWNTLGLDGALRLGLRGLRVQRAQGRWVVDGGAELQALDMASRLSSLRPLGSYRLDLVGGQVPLLSLSTLGGDLRLTGQGQWVGSRLRFSGEATAADDREAQLANLLNIVGRRQGARSFISVG